MCNECKYFDTAFVGTSFATDYCRRTMQRIRDEGEKLCFEKKEDTSKQPKENKIE